MTAANVRGSRKSDIHHMLKRGLRDQDSAELKAMDVDEQLTLEHGLEHSDQCLTVVVNSNPCGMFGVVRQNERAGVIWFLGTDDLFKASRKFLRESKVWLDRISSGYDLVGNIVHKDNKVSIRWLSWLGFEFFDSHGDFINFARIQHVRS
ncbi:MAG: putative scaffold protein [Prokaryotic dsDNA virus sp.]|nr:MAG: putative scaffold protein [Prokaryotic dsDNA virus sp.]|tara:strand:- start:20475 stop:20924 length:450 start_codon:yes stop_codon:yes gene_type:complete